MKKIMSLLNNQRGSYAIISVILIFIILSAITAYTDIIKKRWTINEVQSVMDASGTNALKTTVDLKGLYKEKVGGNGYYTDENKTDAQIRESLNKIVDTAYKNKIRDAYVKELNQQVQLNDVVQGMTVERVDVSFDYSNFGLGKSVGRTVKNGSQTRDGSRPQFAIDSIVRMKVKTSQLFDVGSNATSTIYSSRNNANFQVSYKDAKEDGYTELIIRSVTRLVYR